MSDLLKTKSAEAQTLLAQAIKEEKELETLNRQYEEISQKVANLKESANQKRVYADSLIDATKRLGGIAPVVEITSAKKAAKATKGVKAAKATAAPTTVAAPVAAAAPAKETKGKVKGKPGKTAKAAEKTAAPAKTAAPKKAKTAATAAEKPGDDKKPPLRERLRIVMGDDQVTIPLAIERLKARDGDWLPESKDLNAYISLALSTHKETFERVTRGVYKVRKEAATTVTAVAKPVKKAVNAQKTNGTHNPSNNIEDLGSNIVENPFSETAAA